MFGELGAASPPVVAELEPPRIVQVHLEAAIQVDLQLRVEQSVGAGLEWEHGA